MLYTGFYVKPFQVLCGPSRTTTDPVYRWGWAHILEFGNFNVFKNLCYCYVVKYLLTYLVQYLVS